MAFTATQYLLKVSSITSTTTATVGGYTVPASTRGQVMTLVVANTASTAVRNFVDVQVYDGATTYFAGGRKVPIDPGGVYRAVGVQKQTLSTGAAIYVTAYATTGIDAVMSIVEIT